MVNHIVFWNFKPELTEQEREEAGKMIRQSLEAVRGKSGRGHQTGGAD